MSPDRKIGAHIVVVDNDVPLANLIKTVLSGAGHDVTTCYHPADALQRIKSHRPDLVISDIRMPLMLGTEMVEQLDQDQETSGIPVIFISGTDNLNDCPRLKTRFLQKPFGIEQLERVVTESLNGYQASTLPPK